MASNPFQTSPYSIPESSKTADDFADSPQEAVASKPPAPVRTGGAPTKADLARRASELGVDPDLALSFFTQESSGNWNSRNSPKGAVGGMQVMPGTYKAMMGTSEGHGDPWNNMEAGLRYIAYGQKRLGTKDPELLAAGYHAGYDRKDLREGRIPGTNDGMISTADYARSVAARVRKARGLSGKADDENSRFADTPEDALRSAAPMFVDTQEEALSMAPSDRKFAGKPSDQKADPSDAKFRSMDKKPEDQSWFSRFTEAGAEGYDDMASTLGTTAWAFGKGTDEEAAAAMAESLSKQSKRQQTATQQEIDKAYKAVSDAKGVVDTTVAGAKALWASATNPEETSIEIARNAANSLPSLGLGVAGAGTGAAVGAAIGAPAGGVGAAPVALIGAIRGGRVGMAIGTTATELGTEVREMVQKRLQEQKLEPTAQNILAIISDKGFKEQARKQGLAKGLTIAAVDQLFMGIGGKITTAPARKIALRELADQGMDIATRTARNKALSSAAGKAALESAKPAAAARIGAGVAATLVDSSGESFGEGASQKVARGEVDYGESLREGVVSLGQSAAQTGIGTTIEGAKVVARASREKVGVTGTTPSQAAGPLQRAKENAATEPERVIVTAKDGQVAGTVTGQTESGVQVTGDDGQVYQFTTGPDGVKIAPVPEPAPLSNAIETAANDNAATVQQEAPETSPAQQVVEEQQAEAPAEPEIVPQPEQPATTEAVAASPEAAPTVEQTAAEQPNIEAPALSEMTEQELRARLKYIAEQAKGNGGWNQMLIRQRSLVEKEINARTAKAEPVATSETTTSPGSDAGNGFKHGPQAGERYRVGVVDSVGGAVALEKRLPAGTAATFYVGSDGSLVDGDSIDLSRPESRARLWTPANAEQSGQATQLLDEMGKLALNDPKRAEIKRRLKDLVTGVQATQAQQAAALPQRLSGAKPRYNYGKKQFDLTFESDVDKAAYIAAQKTPSKRDADYVKFVMDSTGMTEDEVRAHGAQVKAAIKAMAKDASPGTLKVPEVARGQTRIEKTPAPTAELAPAAAPEFAQEGNVPSRQTLMKSEAAKRAREVEANGKSAVDDPLVRALDAIYNPLQANDKDAQLHALNYGEQNNRSDIAAEARANLTTLADKLEREAESDTTTPAVPQTSPKYQKIKADLEARKAKKGADAAEIRARLAGKKPASEVSQPAPIVGTTEEWAGASQPPQAAPAYTRRVYRGSGRKDKGSAYNGGDTPILGVAKYYALDEKTASKFGPNIEERDVSLRNPLIINSDQQWRALTREAGWEFPNPHNLPQADIQRSVDGLQKIVRDRGYDGVVIDFDPEYQYDVMPDGRGVKTLRNVFGDPQVIVFDGAPATEPKTLADMTEPELRGRLKYIAGQAKINGWTKPMMAERRKVEAEINKRVDQAKRQGDLGFKEAFDSLKDGGMTADIYNKAFDALQSGKDTISGIKDPIIGRAQKAYDAGLIKSADDIKNFEKNGYPSAEQAAPSKTKTASKEDLDRLFGVDKKREKAMERIANGTAFFHDGVKAKDFIKKNGLSETHEVKKGKGGRWDVVAKAEAPAAQPKPTTATNSGDGAVAPKSQERTYNIVAINEKTGEKTLMTSKPVTHDEAVSIKSKISDNPARRIQLEEAEAAAQPESKAVSDFIEGKRDTAPTVEEVKAKQDAPGTRINGEAERAAADRLEKLHEQMGNITQRNSREGNAKAALRSIIEELRKPKTVVSIVPVLDGAANGLDKNYGAMADVVRDVAATLDGQNDELDAEMRGYERRRTEIDAQHKANREALKSLKVGDEVEYTAPGTYTQTDGSKREGRVVRGKIDKIMDADMGLVNVGNATVGARMLRKVEAAPLDAMAQGAEDAKAGKPRTPPAGMTAKQRFQWTQGYDSQAGTTPASQQPKTDTSAFANNKIFTADAVEKARARLRSKLGNLNSGIDPEVVIDGMTLAGAYIEAGTRSFAAYAKAMVDDFGPKIKPYLLSFYEAARNYPGLDTQGMTPVADAKAEFDALLTGVDLAEVKEAVGEKAPAPAKRAKKTGSSADATLTQDFGVEHINGYGDGTREVGNDVKDAFLKDARSYLKAVADILTQRGFMAHTDRKGKAMNPVNVNESGMAGSGYVSLALRLPEVGSGIYVHIGDTALRGMVPMTPSGIAVMFRATTENDPYGGKQNRWAPTDLSAADFADMLEKEARQNAKEPNNEPQKLDQSGPRELEGKQPEALQGAEPVWQAGAGSAAGSGADARGNERAGGSGNEQPGRMGNDAGEVPSLAARRGARRGGEQGGGSVQGSDRAAKPDPANAERGNQRELIPTDGTRAQDRADDFTITDEDAIGEGGAKTKFKQNVAAIRLLKQLQAEGRQATRAEQAVLAKYVGWGGIPQAFYRDNGEVSKGWEKEAAELKELMTPDELAAAAASTRNAHYTSPEIVAAVWDAAKHFGFQGGRVLEPSVGVGNFFGLMPSALRSASQLTGVELDHITGGIAKQLYPAANIQAPVGFQDFTAPDNYFDLAIGNPPFGREGIYDANRRKISGFSIHNYFFAKSIDTVKPNGVLAMVVTNRLLDSMGDKARQYIADRAEFLGAIRLPNNAFLKNAGTEVTTDIIFLRKLKDGEQPTGQRWMEVKQVTDKNGKTVPLNEYFVRNPDMMLGEFGAFGSMYSPDDAALVARPGQDTPALLREAMAKLPAGFMDPPTAEPTRETIEPMNDVSHVKVGSVFEQDGQIFERREDMLGKQQAAPVTFASEKAKERVSGMIKVRDALIAVRRLQLTEGVYDKALEEARAGLNKAYDAFVKAHGPINGEANKRLMRDDPTWPQLAALEDDFDKGITPAVAKTTGEKARPPSAKKAAIFFKRTQSPYKAPEKAATAKDALVTSLAERGRVDLDYMASLYGKTPEAIANELEGLIFEVVPGDYVTREEYLSGNVKKRLALTIELAKKFPRFQKNVDALREVQPADIEAVDIDVKTGAHWVPADVMQAFVGYITEGQNVKAIYNPIAATWTLNAYRVPQSAMTQWGTDRANVLKVLEAAANQKQIQIFDEHRDGTRTMNEAATTAANEKVERVKAEWKSWIWADDARRTRLHRIYNDTFNTDVQRDYDGSHLTFPGKVGNDIISLRPHQANAVWRMVQSGTTLLDHVVGAGKTFTMIAGVMEMRRMGLAKKPMLVVPNHLVGQWAEDFMKLYPGANILAATKKDFEKDNRKKLFARIATGDWDAVIVAHSSFGKVEVEPEFQEAFIRQQINDMDTSISAMRASEGKSSRNVKQIEKQKAALEEKLKRLFDTGSKDDNLYFGELGVDAVFVDEAHEFKNLGFSTGMQRVAGLGNPTGSNKAADMFMKVQSVLKRTGGKNVVFATGTPISNTMAEMYTMQRYLDYQTLKDQGIAHFDAWAKTFGEVVTDWELSPSGQYKMNSRFAKFVNMPELMQRYQSFADVINRDDINRQLAEQGKKLPVPKVATGKPENIVVERSQDQARYIGIPTVDENGVETYPQGSLVWRAENLPKKAEKGADNMLKIMSDARKAALDMRLIAPGYPDNPGSKVNVAADNIKAIYDKWEADKGTQLVFIDLSTPKGAVAKEAAALRELVRLAEEGDEAAQEKLDAMSPDELLALDSSFSVYDDLKAKLIGLGISEKEIAFIHDANTELQKEELFAKVRTGRVRVLFGSTAKMGAGMNVQERLVALHHLDAPWRPSDLEQREGRIIRQGNKLYDANPEGFEVRILRYATKQTLDSRMWQTIEAKARFIEQVRKGAGNTREVEDVAGEAANSAEMKAASSGNPLILEEMSLRQAIRKLENSQAEHNREQHRIRDRLRTAADMAKHYDAEAEVMEADAPKAPKAFAVKIGKQTFDKHGEAGEAILAAVDAMLKAGEDSREIGTYGGFKLTVDEVQTFTFNDGVRQKGAVLTVTGQGEYQVEANPGSAATGLALRLQNTVKGIGAEAEHARAAAQRNRDDIPKLEAQIKPWGQDQELAEAKARHAAVIEQLKPKKKEQPAGEQPAFSRLESVFSALEGDGRNRIMRVLDYTDEAEIIRYIDKNFVDILGELDDAGRVKIEC